MQVRNLQFSLKQDKNKEIRIGKDNCQNIVTSELVFSAFEVWINPLQGYDDYEKFIATQHPTPTTEHDFWKMIVETVVP